MLINIFYNGTSSNYETDFAASDTYPHGEIVSRFGYYVNEYYKSRPNQGKVLRINGLGTGKPDSSKAKQGAGNLSGLGMRDDVQSILEFVLATKKELEEQGKGDSTLSVVLMGWSRGGIGCIYAAHMLAKLWTELKTDIQLQIQLITFDPVSGAGTNVRALDMSWTETFLNALGVYFGPQPVKGSFIANILSKLVKWWELPVQVKAYNGFYAHDERSTGFATTMPSMTGDMSGRTYTLYEVPGTHSVLVGNYTLGSNDSVIRSTGLSIYNSVVQKVNNIMQQIGVQFAGAYRQWLSELQKAASSFTPTPDNLKAFSLEAQQKYITLSRLLSGRSVYLGDNMLDREWEPDVSLSEFLHESNKKFFLDIFSGIKQDKLASSVHIDNYPAWGKVAK